MCAHHRNGGTLECICVIGDKTSDRDNTPPSNAHRAARLWELKQSWLLDFMHPAISSADKWVWESSSKPPNISHTAFQQATITCNRYSVILLQLNFMKNSLIKTWLMLTSTICCFRMHRKQLQLDLSLVAYWQLLKFAAHFQVYLSVFKSSVGLWVLSPVLSLYLSHIAGLHCNSMHF